MAEGKEGIINILVLIEFFLCLQLLTYVPEYF